MVDVIKLQTGFVEDPGMNIQVFDAVGAENAEISFAIDRQGGDIVDFFQSGIGSLRPAAVANLDRLP